MKKSYNKPLWELVKVDNSVIVFTAGSDAEINSSKMDPTNSDEGEM